MLLVPTALSSYTVDEVVREESAAPPKWTQNAKLGRMTNFVNLLDMCGIAVPSGLMVYDAAEAVKAEPDNAAVQARAAHLAATGPTKVNIPFGVTLLAKAWHDDWLAGIAERMQELAGLGCGPAGHGVAPVLPPNAAN